MTGAVDILLTIHTPASALGSGGLMYWSWDRTQTISPLESQARPMVLTWPMASMGLIAKPGWVPRLLYALAMTAQADWDRIAAKPAAAMASFEVRAGFMSPSFRVDG
jgi:hypothetical protein